MELLVSGINSKLRKTVVQSRRIQVFSELLEKESNLKNLIKIADKFIKQILPEDSEIVFGLFDEKQSKLTLYSNVPPIDIDAKGPLVFDEIYFSQLPAEYQHVLFGDHRLYLSFDSSKKLPDFMSRIHPIAFLKDYLFLPVKKYGDAIGFLFMGSSEKGTFGKLSVKYYQRLARVFSNAVFGQIYFHRHQKNSEFVSIMDELDERVLQREPMETTIDFCMDSLIKLLDVERASVMLYEKKDKTLSLYAAKGYKVYPFSGIVLQWGEGLAGWALKESKIIAIPKLKDDRKTGFIQRALNGNKEPQEMSVRSLLCVPLTHMNNPVGVINISTLTYNKHFEQSEITMVNQFGQRIASAMTSLASIKDFESYIRSAHRLS